MDAQTRLSIEWPGALSEEAADGIVADLARLPDASAALQTENALGGLEDVINTIVIAMTTKLGEKMVETVWSALAALKKRLSGKSRTVVLSAAWEGGQVKLQLPIGEERQVKEKLRLLGDLIAGS